jgi:hypothetical protein
VVVAATVVPAVVVWLVVGTLNPPHRDLSDIATGLMQLGLSVLAAAAGFVVSLVVTRP